MLYRLTRVTIATALACSIGLHWGFLQSAAWVGMVIHYSQDAPLEEALVKTFDGKHPCALCKEIAKGKASEKKSESAPAEKRFEFSYSSAVFVFVAPSHYWKTGWPNDPLSSLVRTPPVPPPRQLPG